MLPEQSFCFFFKQKTAYEMRISDWSSDVCSSDLFIAAGARIEKGARIANSIVLSNVVVREHACVLYSIISADCTIGVWYVHCFPIAFIQIHFTSSSIISEERRVG